jgi:hypothetical protein
MSIAGAEECDLTPVNCRPPVAENPGETFHKRELCFITAESNSGDAMTGVNATQSSL